MLSCDPLLFKDDKFKREQVFLIDRFPHISIKYFIFVLMKRNKKKSVSFLAYKSSERSDASQLSRRPRQMSHHAMNQCYNCLIELHEIIMTIYRSALAAGQIVAMPKT